jgi:hypothetical protein
VKVRALGIPGCDSSEISLIINAVVCIIVHPCKLQGRLGDSINDSNDSGFGREIVYDSGRDGEFSKLFYVKSKGKVKLPYNRPYGEKERRGGR